jgi:Mlc titration factor MtfA (ptsG expression regulator)
LNRALAWLGLPLVITFLVVWLLRGEALFWLRGARTTGKITGVEVVHTRPPHITDTDDGQAGPSYHLLVHYRFLDAQGEERFGSDTVDGTALVRSYYQPGREVVVVYRHDEPERNQLGSTVSFAGFSWLLVALLVGAAIIGVAVLAGQSDRVRAMLAWLGGRSVIARLVARRRRHHLGQAFPFAWERILRSNLGLFAQLTPMEQERLKNIVRVLVAEKEWTGCQGLQMTDEVRVTIAGAAAVLLLGREHDYYETVRSILVYPTTFEVPAEHADESGLVLRGKEPVLGQAWYRGPVLLAWDEVLSDCRHLSAGRNVVLHEFAHQLDFAGVPLAPTGTDGIRRFGDVMQAEYTALVHASEQGRATLLDEYGATNPAEFFAVATECFFGQPLELLQLHPHLYEVLHDFYNQDSARRAGHSPV